MCSHVMHDTMWENFVGEVERSLAMKKDQVREELRRMPALDGAWRILVERVYEAVRPGS